MAVRPPQLDALVVCSAPRFVAEEPARAPQRVPHDIVERAGHLGMSVPPAVHSGQQPRGEGPEPVRRRRR